METFFDPLTTTRQGALPRIGLLEFRAYLAAVEGLLVPDKPGVPGKSRINMSLFPRSRLRVNPTLRPPKPRLPSPPKPSI